LIRKEGKIMAGKIWRYDCYDLRKFKPGDIDVFIDIGANVGSTSLQAKVLNPTARIISFEPDKEIFKWLKNIEIWGLECHNIALGNGSPMCCHIRGGSGEHRFYSDDEKDWWPEDSYTIESKTTKQIFEDYDVSLDKNYIIKIDCEGGERFWLQNQEEAIKYVSNSVQTMMELHMGIGGKMEQWNEFFKQLRDTHELRLGGWKYKNTPKRRWEFTTCDEIAIKKGYVSVELVNRDWVGPWPGKGM